LCTSGVLLAIPTHSPLYRLPFVYAAGFVKSLKVSFVPMERLTFGSQPAVEMDAQVVSHVLEQACHEGAVDVGYYSPFPLPVRTIMGFMILLGIRPLRATFYRCVDCTHKWR